MKETYGRFTYYDPFLFISLFNVILIPIIENLAEFDCVS